MSANGQSWIYCLSDSRTVGRTGTIRSLFPFPVTMSRSPSGRTLALRLMASETRRPHPYNIVKTAVSRASHQLGLFWLVLDFSSRVFASSTSMGFGSNCGSLGVRMASRAVASMRSCWCSHFSSERIPHSERANERAHSPLWRRCARNARISETRIFSGKSGEPR